ncbi:MAG: cell division protein FtsB [Gammaproteobacteria bacterium]|nr:cell division protein FtsB [Gammaproteobacteria bacterium]MCW8987047.1 cell division protein FtsB [Gammaproteobacteria bacterium]MCW9030171.1 cell division protein FtsB [Gammaproteobacteria bacterium]
MRYIAIILGLLFFVLQYELWIGEGSLATIWQLQKGIDQQKMENTKIANRNQSLLAEVNDLKQGDTAIEERARNELGMIKKGETYIQVVDDKKENNKE